MRISSACEPTVDKQVTLVARVSSACSYIPCICKLPAATPCGRSCHRFFVEHLGNYSCVFYNATGRVVKTFIVTGPAMKELRSKPIVGYAGDSTVLTCKIYPAPLSWLWYKVNGSEKEVVNTTVQSAHYKVMVKDEEVLLVVMSLTEEDSGSYLCVAHYPISPVEGVVHLKIITFMEPLKPFLVILTEVLLLVSLIAVCELRGRRSTAQADMATSENGMHVTEVEKPKLEERNGTEETATRQRKV
ncbi:embigin [Arapaima gigas]